MSLAVFAFLATRHSPLATIGATIALHRATPSPEANRTSSVHAGQSAASTAQPITVLSESHTAQGPVGSGSSISSPARLALSGAIG